MEYDNGIKQLLDKYFAGGTTIDEEKLLHEFFMSDNVPEELLYAKAMFGYFADSALRRSESEIVVPQVEIGSLRSKSIARRILYTVSSVAAVVLVAVTVSLSLNRRNIDTVYCYLNGHPVEDMELAREQSRVALNLLSDAFDASTSTLKGLSVSTDETDNSK